MGSSRALVTFCFLMRVLVTKVTQFVNTRQAVHLSCALLCDVLSFNERLKTSRQVASGVCVGEGDPPFSSWKNQGKD